MRNYLVAGLLASMLCACGGGSGSSNPATISNAASSAQSASAPAIASSPTAASSLASTPIVKIAVFGDDQMVGISSNATGMIQTVTPNEPAQLQTMMQTEFSDTGITVQNISSGGTSSSLQNELDGMDGLGDGQPQRMQASGASIVIEEHALNDALGGETVAEYSAYLGQWIQDAQSAGLQPVLEEPGPVCDGNHPQLPVYVAAMDASSAQYNVPLIKQYEWISAMPNWQDHMIDCLVPDTYLDALKAKAEQAVIGPLAAKISG